MNKYITIQALNKRGSTIATAELPVEFYNDRRMDLIAKVFERLHRKAAMQGEERVTFRMME